jgi:hypothetical protein
VLIDGGLRKLGGICSFGGKKTGSLGLCDAQVDSFHPLSLSLSLDGGGAGGFAVCV